MKVDKCIEGNQMYALAKDLFPICRSITGNGVRMTLSRLINEVPCIKLHEIPSGESAFDWVVPDEWEIKEAYIEDESGERIVDFYNNNLHLVGYSIPVDEWLTLKELDEHLFSLPDHPNWIPYVTSYYSPSWGFCLPHNQRKRLKNQRYHVVIKSRLFKGSLTYGELIIPGREKKEIFLSTYVCHPSMANNELSGPVVQLQLAKWILNNPDRRYTYRLIWIPETIGSIAYLSKHLGVMKNNIIAGYNITCVGDNKEVSFVESRYGNTLADVAALNVLRFIYPDFKFYSFLHRGSDERQYNSPGVDLPVCSVCCSKYHEYPEYHTSADNLRFISPDGLQKAFNIYKHIISSIEYNHKYKVNCLCEPQLGKRGLYPNKSFNKSSASVKNMMDFIAYCDGNQNLFEISNKINVSVEELHEIATILQNADIIKIVE